MIGKRTIFIVLLVLFVVDMIQAGVVDDIRDAIHYEDIKKFTQDAAQKTGEAATNAFNNVKNFFAPAANNPSVAPDTTTKATS